MGRIVFGVVLIVIYAVLILIRLTAAPGWQGDITPYLVGFGVPFLIPGLLFVYVGWRSKQPGYRGAKEVTPVIGIVFFAIHFFVVRDLMAGRETWGTEWIVLLNVGLDTFGLLFLLGPIFDTAWWKRLSAGQRNLYGWSAIILVTGSLMATEIIVNNRHRHDLLPRLRSSNVHERIEAAEMLASSGYRAGVKEMAAALHDESADVRIAAAQALGKSVNDDATPALIAALDDAKPLVQRTAIEALARLKDRRAVPALVRVLDRRPTGYGGYGNDEEAATRVTAAKALLKFDEKDYGPIVQNALAKDDCTVIAAAHEFLIKQGKHGTERSLVTTLDNCGSKEMALNLLNSGNPELMTAAERWAKSRGYKIERRAGSPNVEWGTR